MTAPAKTIAPWRSLSAAAAQMLEEGIKRLPVVDSDGKLVGILSRADLVRAFARPDAEIEREIREDVLQRALWLATPEAVSVAVRDGRVELGGSAATRTDASERRRSEHPSAEAGTAAGCTERAATGSADWRASARAPFGLAVVAAPDQPVDRDRVRDRAKTGNERDEDEDQRRETGQIDGD